MKIVLPYNAKVTIYSPRERETIIEFEDNWVEGLDATLKAFLDSGLRAETSTVNEFFEKHQDELHQYLQDSGYIFNKA